MDQPCSAVCARHLVPDLPSAVDLLPFLRRIDQARWYSNFGPLVCELEERLQGLLEAADRREQHGRIHLTTLCSGYHALEAALRLIGRERGRVLVPAITFSACPLAVENAGF